MPLDPEFQEMRRIGYQAVDRAIEHLSGLRDLRVATPPTASELQQLCAEPLPMDGRGVPDSLERFFQDLLPRATLVNHPRFFAYIPGPGSFAGAIGEWVAAATNTFVGTWLGGAVMAQLEVQTLDWMRQAIGLQQPRTGLVTTGGSMANLGGIAAGLSDLPRDRAVVYVGIQGHYSLEKAAKVLGVTHLRKVADDPEQCIDLARLQAAIATDRQQGLVPAVVSATCGTTNTGSIDDLAGIADLCAQQGLWLHCDAAYGGAAALLDEFAHLRAAIERTDSLTLDPHKWFYAPFECGCLLVKDGKRLAAAFGGDAAYMQDIPREETNFFALGPELTRGARALKLWFVLRSHGIEAIAQHVRRDIELAQRACALLRTDPRIEILTPPRLSIFTFAVTAANGGDQAGRKLVDDLLADGTIMLSSTRVNDRFAIRFCVVNHRTSERDIELAVDCIRRLLP